MAYEPKHWHYDDDLTEHDLNRIEEGIKGVSDEVTSSSTTQLPITHGVNLVTLEKRAGLPSLSIKGKTAVNLIPPFTSTRWNINSIFNERTTDRIEGTPETKEQSAICKVNLKKNTQYYIACKGENVRIRLRNPEGAYIVEVEGFELAFSSDQYEELDVIFSPITAENWADFVLEHVTLNEGTEPINFVHGFQSIRNPMIESFGQNLSRWEMGSLSLLNGNEVPSTSSARTDFIRVIPGQYYRAEDFTKTSTGCNFHYYDENYNRIGGDGSTFSSYHFYSRVPMENTAYIRVVFDNVSLNNKLQVSIGSSTNTYAPYRLGSKSYYPDLTLASNEDGSVYDELLPSGEVVKRFEHVVLDGQYSWKLFDRSKGFHVVRALADTPNYTYDLSKYIVSKYNGVILININADNISTVDQANLYSNKNVYISISPSDSGWGDSYTPAEEEIKAYFNGWRMYGIGDVTTPYTSGSKRWAKIWCGVGVRHSSGLVVGGTEVSTVPTTVNDMGYTPYKLQYQLAEPIIEKVNPVGRIQLHKGNNQIEVVEGFISREKMSLYFLQPNIYQWNNALRSPETWAKNKVLKIVNIYKNSDVDTNSWSMWRDNSFGVERATITSDKFDPNATYYVDYIALPSEFTASIEHASLHIPTSLVSQVEKVEAILSDESIGQDRGLAERLDSLQGEMQELFTSVDNGKNDLRTAIIEKGGAVQGTQPNSFADLVAGVNSISVSPLLHNSLIGTTTIPSSSLESNAINLPDDAIINFNYSAPSGTTYLSGTLIRPVMYTNGTVKFTRPDVGSNIYIGYQILRFRDVKQIIRGSGTTRTISMSNLAHSITLPQSVDRHRSIVVASLICTNGTTDIFQAGHMFRYYLQSNTVLNVSFAANTTSSRDWIVDYQIVEFN